MSVKWLSKTPTVRVVPIRSSPDQILHLRPHIWGTCWCRLSWVAAVESGWWTTSTALKAPGDHHIESSETALAKVEWKYPRMKMIRKFFWPFQEIMSQRRDIWTRCTDTGGDGRYQNRSWPGDTCFGVYLLPSETERVSGHSDRRHKPGWPCFVGVSLTQSEHQCPESRTLWYGCSAPENDLPKFGLITHWELIHTTNVTDRTQAMSSPWYECSVMSP